MALIDIHPDAAVGSIATSMERAIPYFENQRIDYAYDGDRPLREACSNAGVPLEEAVAHLEKLRRQLLRLPRPPIDWNQQPLQRVIDHLLQEHHFNLRIKLAKTWDLVEKSLRLYGLDHPQLYFLRDLFARMRDQTEDQMGKEENTLFPYLIDKEREESHPSFPSPSAELPQQLFQTLRWERHRTNEDWTEVRLLTEGYSPPSFAGATFRDLYDELRELEQDIHFHIHAENNILFQRAAGKGWLG